MPENYTYQICKEAGESQVFIIDPVPVTRNLRELLSELSAQRSSLSWQAFSPFAVALSVGRHSNSVQSEAANECP